MLTNLNVPFSDLIGIIGVLLTLSAYYCLNTNKLPSDSLVYLFLNLIGSIFLLFSLAFNWNLSAVLIETAWISISMIGIYRLLRVNQNDENRL